MAEAGASMTEGLSARRRIIGWTFISVGKVGTLLLLWMLLTSADITPPQADKNIDTVLTRIGAIPLLATTVGILATGLWLLLGSERRPRTHGD